jgi:hypothetical protein
MEEFGIETSQGLIQLPKAVLKKTTVTNCSQTVSEFRIFSVLAEHEVLGWFCWKFGNSRIPKDPIRV